MLQEERYIIDTSIWIDYFRHGVGKVFDFLEELLDEDKVVLCGPVEMEIFSGLRPSEKEEILEIFDVLPYINSERSDYQLAGVFLNTYRKKGITIPPMDCLIAAMAIRRNFKVLTFDKHFDYFDSLKSWQNSSH